MTDAASILMNDKIDKVSSTSASSLVTSAASILTNDALEKINSALSYNLVTNAANIDLILPLLPFPNASLPCNFDCIKGIYFTYHPL